MEQANNHFSLSRRQWALEFRGLYVNRWKLEATYGKIEDFPSRGRDGRTYFSVKFARLRRRSRDVLPNKVRVGIWKTLNED